MNCWTNVADKLDMIRLFIVLSDHSDHLETGLIVEIVGIARNRWANFSAILAIPVIPTIIWKPGLNARINESKRGGWGGGGGAH